MSEFEYVYDKGTLRGTVFQIGARLSPSKNNIESFAVILFFELKDGTRVEVAKVDNSKHEEGDVHVDRYYREPSVDPHDFDVDIDDWWEADKYLEDNWRRFGEQYLDTHGKRPR